MNPPKRECRNCINFIFHQIKKNDEGINREICSLNHEFVGNRRSACLYHRFFTEKTQATK